ncbi:MAG: DinB family protein [Acidobacteriota bacterium]|nr:DinB family protein [Acidobacteriota bacterium]
MSIADSILAEFNEEAATTKRLLDRVPAGHLGWRPHPKSMSLGQLALHIAEAPGSVAEAALPDAMEAPGFVQAEAKSVEEVYEAFARGIERVKTALNQMDDTRITAMWSLTLKGEPIMTMPRVAFLRAIMLNHTYHHRGQLSVYLRLLDVPLPSIYGPSADTNPLSPGM